MDERFRIFSKLTVALLLMVFVFALGNMIFNLENLNLGGENVPEFVEGSAQQSNAVATSATLAHALRWIYFGFLGFLVLTVIVGIFSFSKSKDKDKWRNLFYQMAGSLIIVALIIAMGLFYEDIENTMDQAGSTDILPGGGTGNASAANGTGLADGPDSSRVISTFALFGLFFTFWALIFIVLVRLARSRSSKLDYSDIDLKSQEVEETIQRTIDALAGGSDTRAEVIRCYTDMCKVMARHGVVEQEHLTPREFESLARESLPVPDREIHNLVMVFEEARYSDHELTDDDGRKASNALEEVRQRLRQAREEQNDRRDD